MIFNNMVMKYNWKTENQIIQIDNLFQIYIFIWYSEIVFLR